MKVNSQIKFTNLRMLIVLCLNISMAYYLMIDIRHLLAQLTELEVTLLIVSQIKMRPIIIIILFYEENWTFSYIFGGKGGGRSKFYYIAIFQSELRNFYLREGATGGPMYYKGTDFI